MDLRFITPSLRKLDLAGSEVLAACTFENERPPHGVAGLVDFRLAGRVSNLMLRGDISGKLGEVALLPGKPRLSFDKVLLFGGGDLGELNDRVFGLIIEGMLATLSGLRARSAVVELPGRHVDAIEPDRAADLLLERAASRPEHDLWTLVEPVDAQRVINQRMIQERRRVRTL
ncbi:MAG TPA: M17 family peptidase N-terminal domain-containing protein [Polyangiaceae bacterium]|nr:M17 family peptidase N-terminal domain-containing protein [Polyangiaceae bacterium]